MNKKQTCLACAVLAGFSSLVGFAHAGDAEPLPGTTDTARVQLQPAQAESAQTQAMEPEPAQAELAPTEPAPTEQAPTEQAQSESGPQVARAFPGKKISLAPLPVEIYLLDDQKPTVVFTTPCIQIEKMTHGFPPIIAFENFMFTWIGNVNDSNLLPIRLEPVCI